MLTIFTLLIQKLINRSSLFDHFGAGFTLMATAGVAEAAREADIQADLETASADALRLNVPLKVLRPNNPAVASLYPRRLTLIRPDQHVAWAGEGWPSWEEFDVFLMATGRLPCLSRVEQAAVSSSSTAVTALQVRP